MTPDTAEAQATSIIQALDHPALFAPYFTGTSWNAWRSFLAALTAEPMTPDELAIYQACTGRTAPPDKPFSEAALIVGRRGKSRVLALIAVCLATLRDYTPFLAPGEVATIAVLAANRPQARSIFRYALGLMKAVPALQPMIEDDNTEAITLNNRVVIEISTASFRTARGYSFAAVLCDEIAFWRQDETSANPDVEILRALRPGMASIPGSILLLASSPYAKRGELHAAYRRHYGKDGARVLVWKAPTATMNPRIDSAIIAEAYESDPESARAEYGAEFRDDLADFVTREVVEAVTPIGRSELPPMPGVTYSAFCDPSGGASDAMTLAIGHLDHTGMAILDAVREARPPFSPEAVVIDFAALLKAYGISHVTGDRYGGEWPRQRFKEHGISYDPSARPKSNIYVDLLPLLNAARVELLDVPRLAAQLVGLERRVARSGKDSVDHTPGGHDDLANAVAGVLVGLDLDRRPAMVSASDMLTGGAPLPFPAICDAVFATLAIDKHGMVAVCYASTSRHIGARFMLLDFDTPPFHGQLLGMIASRLKDLALTCRARHGSLGVFVPETLAHHAAATSLHAHPTPQFDDAAALMLSAAGHIAEGRVKVSELAHQKAQTSPLGGALDFRAGEGATDDPLRATVLSAIAIALDPPQQ